MFHLHINPFTNRDLKQHLAQLLGKHPQQISQGTMSYELRRLRLRGLIERRPGTNRYQVTDYGLRVAALNTFAYDRLLCPGFAASLDPTPPAPSHPPLHKDPKRYR